MCLQGILGANVAIVLMTAISCIRAFWFPSPTLRDLHLQKHHTRKNPRLVGLKLKLQTSAAYCLSAIQFLNSEALRSKSFSVFSGFYSAVQVNFKATPNICKTQHRTHMSKSCISGFTPLMLLISHALKRKEAVREKLCTENWRGCDACRSYCCLCAAYCC